MKFDSKKIIPHLIAIGVFLVLTFIFFAPLFSGEEISQHDIMQWQGMSKEIQDFRDKFHTEPLWTNSMFCGMPAYQISVLYPANLMSYIHSVITLGLLPPAAFVFLGLLSFYILLITLRMDFRVAIAGAIAYAFVSYNFVIILAGHNSKAHAIALMPLVIAGVLMVFNKRYLLGGALAALGLALEVYANHLQITYYLMITIAVLAVSQLIFILSHKDFKHLFVSGFVLILAVVLGVLPNITNLMATEEYGKYSTRSQSELTAKKSSTGLDEDYALQYSYGKWETVTLLVPNAVGGSSATKLDENSALAKAIGNNPQAQEILNNAPVYWGALYSTSGTVYVGAIVIFLFIVGLFLADKKYKWWLLFATILGIMLSWGKNLQWFTDIFFNYFPAYNKFRSVSMMLVIPSLTIPILAFLGLQKLLDPSIPVKQKQKVMLNSLYISLGACLLVIAGGASQGYNAGEIDQQLAKSGWPLEAIREDRASLLKMDAFRSMFFIAAAFAALWFWLKGKLKQNLLYIVLIGLVLIDNGLVAKRYINADSFKEKKIAESFVPSLADQQILADKELGFRVMNLTVSTFNDASTSYFHRSIGGYHGAKLKRYQELVENQISKNNQSVLDMLNTKYFIMQNKQNGQPEAQTNPGASGPAWFVSEYSIVPNADAEMQALDKFNPHQTVFIDKRYDAMVNGFKIIPDSTASIKLVDYKPNHLTYKSNATSDQLAVFSEIYYDKGWDAFIDGKKSDYFRCNYVLRGMKVPAGEHTIEYKFEPTVYATGEKISMVGSVIIILGFLFVVILEIRKPNSIPTEQKSAEEHSPARVSSSTTKKKK